MLGRLLEFLDDRVGLDNVVIALSSDHGVVPLPEYREMRGLPGSRIDAVVSPRLTLPKTGVDRSVRWKLRRGPSRLNRRLTPMMRPTMTAMTRYHQF